MLKKNQELCSALNKDASRFTNQSIFKPRSQSNYYTHHLVFTGFIILLILLRLFLRGNNLEIDEAEQLVMARQLDWGYPFQPPLYTWLQYGIFQLLGYRLVSLAILKYSLLMACLYSYYHLCRYYCSNLILAWCALCSWALIISISLDLLKDNTHSILALLLASLTWMWFFTTSPSHKTGWYAVLGLLIGAGCLSKFNYLLFLAALIMTAASLPNERNKLINKQTGITLALAFIIAAPYGLWLLHHHSLGLQSLYKLAPQQNSLAHGLYKYVFSLTLFITPVWLVSSLFFSIPKIQPVNTLTKPLYRYFLISILLVTGLVIFSGFKDFQPRWLIPILFMTPLLFFSQLNQDHSWLQRGRRFILFCLLIQALLIMTLLFRSQAGHQAARELSFRELTQAITQHCSQPNYFYAGNHFLLGTMSWSFPHAQIELQQGNEKPSTYRGGRGVLLWGPEEPPFWINHFKTMAPMGEIISTVNPVNGELFAHFICLKG